MSESKPPLTQMLPYDPALLDPSVDPNTKLPSGGTVGNPMATDVSRDNAAHTLSFYNLGTMGEVFRRSDWDLGFEIGLLQEIAKDPNEKTDVKLKAIKQIAQMRRDAMLASGAMQTVRRTIERQVGESGEMETVSDTLTIARAAAAGASATAARFASRPPDTADPKPNEQ